MTMRAGMGHSRMELPPGLPMDGYGARRSPATGTRDPLEATVLLVADDLCTTVVVSLDLVAVGSSLVERVQRCVHEWVPEAHVMIAATHTHAGPSGVRSAVAGEAVTEAIIDAVRISARNAAATAEAVDAQIGVGELPAGVATNRNTPEAAIDRRLTVLELTRYDGSRVGLLWHTGVHPTVLGPDNLEYSADLPGEVRRRMRNSDEPVLFLNGAAGDVSTRFTRRDRNENELERLGELLNGALPATGHSIVLSPVVVRERTVTLAVAHHDRDHAEQLRRATEQRLTSTQLGTGDRRRLESVLEGLLKVQRGPQKGGSIQARVQVLRMGGLVLICLPGEPVSALSLHQPEDAAVTSLVVGYANGYIGYLTSQPDDYAYETLASQVETGSGAHLMAAANEQVREILCG